MRIKTSKLNGVLLIDQDIFHDYRGYFFESFNEKKFQKIIGKEIKFIQDNESKSSKGVLRGLHFQTPPYDQSKLVRVIEGEVLDVTVDLRKSSPTYGMHQCIKLDSKEKKQIFIPRGFAHGYIVTSEEAIFAYKVDNIYSPENQRTIMWNDMHLNIDWGMPNKELVISEKDLRGMNFIEINDF